MKRVLVILTFLFCTSFSAHASDTLKIYTVSELQDSMKVNPKPIIIYYYTDWCKYVQWHGINALPCLVSGDGCNGSGEARKAPNPGTFEQVRLVCIARCWAD